jgi:DNA-binding response OmpR family regulator
MGGVRTFPWSHIPVYRATISAYTKTSRMSTMIKVLIADDEPAILMSLEFLMRKNGFEVYIARNGAEALQLLGVHTPDVVLLDIMMPDIDGYELCEHIRSQEKTRQTKVIFISAKSRKVDIEKGMEVGADLYVTKPFSTRDLLKKIHNLLGTAYA